MTTDVPTPKKRILIVDDSEDMRILLAQILEEGGYVLLFAENGTQAIAEAIRLRPDLILMDMSLPGVSGWEAVPHLRTLPTFERIPIIAVTAHVSQSDRERALAVGCTAHLGKPFDVMEVLDMIEHLLEKEEIR